MLSAEFWHTIGISTTSRTHKISGTEHNPTDKEGRARAKQVADGHVSAVESRACKFTGRTGRKLNINAFYSVPVEWDKPDPRTPRGGIGIG